jgi:hypothetical protein
MLPLRSQRFHPNRRTHYPSRRKTARSKTKCPLLRRFSHRAISRHPTPKHQKQSPFSIRYQTHILPVLRVRLIPRPFPRDVSCPDPIYNDPSQTNDSLQGTLLDAPPRLYFSFSPVHRPYPTRFKLNQSKPVQILCKGPAALSHSNNHTVPLLSRSAPPTPAHYAPY